ncbi:MAG TPA: GrpB family protein [Nocardioides sp.]|uniref:GrpB family protein n=1 Tax=Nocardioides sp. TaxID=35761 RepID=UPI002CE0E18F|nr:GrpB family protein [Nocardioides sp.]HTW14464.1 GrpB family protein [Nocardioides sp.]
MDTHPLWRPYDVPSEEEIAQARVRAHVPEQIEVVPPDPAWPARYDEVRRLVEQALGERVQEIVHIGSTSVPGLHAKPVIDVSVTVADTEREEDYLPALAAAGFVLTVREPEHRCLRLADPRTNLHVWNPGAAEPRRHVAFRDWLTGHADDLAAYSDLKCSLAGEGFTDVMLYNNRKAGLIYDIYERIFAADPEHPHTPQPRA